MDAPLDVCEQRDVKGLYKKARAGEIRGRAKVFTLTRQSSRIKLIFILGHIMKGQLSQNVVLN